MKTLASSISALPRLERMMASASASSPDVFRRIVVSSSAIFSRTTVCRRSSIAARSGTPASRRWRRSSSDVTSSFALSRGAR